MSGFYSPLRVIRHVNLIRHWYKYLRQICDDKDDIWCVVKELSLTICLCELSGTGAEWAHLLVEAYVAVSALRKVEAAHSLAAACSRSRKIVRRQGSKLDSYVAPWVHDMVP
jgi:hypothetical protein